MYDKDGMSRALMVSVCELELSNLPDSVYKLIKRNIYSQALHNIFSSPLTQTPEVRKKLMFYATHYLKYYYLTPTLSFKDKVKGLVKHILVLLHIHKPRK